MSDLTKAQKIALAMELSTDILVSIIKRRGLAKGMDLATLLAEAAVNNQEADRLLDELEAKGGE